MPTDLKLKWGNKMLTDPYTIEELIEKLETVTKQFRPDLITNVWNLKVIKEDPDGFKLEVEAERLKR
jgi:hypothetical protein